MTDKIVINCPKCSKKVRVPSGKHVKFICPQCGEELEYDDRIEIEQPIEIEEEFSFGDKVINILSWIIVVPIFIILHKLLPNPDWIFNIDRVLIGVLSIGFIRLILHLFKSIVLIAFVISFAWFSYGSIWGDYGFGYLYKDYRALIYMMIDTPVPKYVISSKLKPFNGSSEIKDAIDFNNPEVRNFAVSATRKNFEKFASNSQNRKIIQCFAVFKEINTKWNYVSDPSNQEYFAKASETVKHLSGDCDDHSIFMAACIKAIGGTPRLVRTKGHIYPELLIGTKKDLELVSYLIKRKLFPAESRGQKIHYHTDSQGNVWLNLDYTKHYPGGNFMDKEILGVLMID